MASPNETLRTYVVTGAASGLGAATARFLHAQGTGVVLADLQADAIGQVATELGERCRACRVDVTSEDDVARAIEEARSIGSMRGVVHCAGILSAGRIVGRNGPHDLELFRKTIDVNLAGSFNVLRLCAAAMTDNEPDSSGERGAVVLTASVAAFEGQIGQVAYAAAKGGVAGMVLPAARELGKWGIRVAAIAPGVFETPMMQGAPDAVRNSLIEQTVFPQRLGQPQEFAQFAWHILNNVMINGSTLRLDGAMRMQAK